jgi:NAD(P)-dependent dehydrogenase (short-subunit alcohol dehydrogenase family)
MNKSAQYGFSGKVALVTGGAYGIGRAVAQAFAAQGIQVVVADTAEKGASETVAEIRRRGGEATSVLCDVSREPEVKDLIRKTIATFGRLDYAFNNAGIEGLPAPTPDCTEENWDRVLDVNLKGVWLCMKHEIPVLLQQKNPCAIVNCASIAGMVGFPGVPAYTASKHGVIGLTQTAALEYARTNVRVNVVSPGVIQTPMIDRFTHGEAQALKMLVAGEPVGRMGKPEEVASAVLWLCSDSASFVTGHSLVVDGGWTAQ